MCRQTFPSCYWYSIRSAVKRRQESQIQKNYISQNVCIWRQGKRHQEIRWRIQIRFSDAAADDDGEGGDDDDDDGDAGG